MKWTPLTYGELVEREVSPKDVSGWKLNEFSNYLEENIVTRPTKRVRKISLTSFFHGNDPITKSTIVHI